MRIILLVTFLVAFAPLASAADSASVEQLYGAARGLLGAGVGARIPAPLDILFGNERADIYVTGTTIVVGVVTKDGVVTEVTDGGVGMPTVKIYATMEGLEDTVSGKLDVKKLVRDGSIRAEGQDPVSWVKFAVLMNLLRIFLMVA